MTQKKPLVLAFDHIRAADLPLVGGKGANLGELTHAGFPIPPGFCVTTRAFEVFIDACPTSPALYELLDTVTSQDVETAREVGQKVRETLLEVAMPQQIADAVRQHWQALDENEAYAVRSSATAEDLPDASFAGQQDTYLNIIGETALLDAIHRCWVSLFTDRAILYRSQNHFSHRDVQLSVVVQQMVMSEMSGILFTADPLTGHRYTIAIDASFGLGEALVSGIVSPDTYRVDKRSKTIIERQIADKHVAIYPDKEGGVRQETLDAVQQSQTVLDDEQILKLANLGARVEAHYDVPQDIEWAIVENKTYLLQARPITSLYPIDGLQSPDSSLHIYFSVGHQQNMTNIMSPLGASLMRCILPIGQSDNPFESSYLRVSGGRLFGDLSQPLRHPILKRAVLTLLSQFDALAPEALKAVMRRPEFQAPHGISFPLSVIGGFFRIVYRILAALWWQDLTGFSPRVDAIIAQHIQVSTNQIQTSGTAETQIRTIMDILQSMYLVVLNWVPQFVAGEIAIRLIMRIGRYWGKDIDLEAISLGLPGNAVTEMNMKVGDLADIARQSPQLRALFDNLGDDSHTWLEQVSQVEGCVPFMKAWGAFIEQYGARGPSEIDIAVPHWYEDPLPLLQVIASYLQKEAGSHRVQHRKLIDERERAVERLRSKSKQGVLGWLRSRLIERLLHVVYEASVLREHHKFMMVQMLRPIKDALKNQAAQLAANKRLSQPDDIWFLTFPEIIALDSGDSLDVSTLISTRRRQLKQFQKMSVPRVITSDGETPVVKYHVADAPPGALIGNPVSAGIAEGTVHVIRDPQTETLIPGEILVAPFTDPGWTPLFINAGGLIMEVGGAMNHGSVVAREYGIPAVVGVQGATTALQTGQKVRIDGNRGIIEIL